MMARPAADEATMSFGDHLEELRRRILLAGAPALPLAVVLFFFSDTFIKYLVLPLRRVLEDEQLPPRLQALAPPEVLIIKLKLSLILAAVILAPWILWQTWLFIRPGLYVQERRFVRFLVPGSTLLTAAGIALLYFVMLPLMLRVLVTVGSDLDLGQGQPSIDPRIQVILEKPPPIEVLTVDPDPLAPGQLWLQWPDLQLMAAVADDQGIIEILPVPRPYQAAISQDYRLSTYITFVLMLLLGIVIAFQMPLVILLMGWVGLASPQWLAAQRRYAIFVCGIVAALITPADVVSMLAMLLPLYGLYELGILLLRVAPAGRVAEGGLLARRMSDKRPEGEKPARSSEQPAEPTQPSTSVPRSSKPSRPEGDSGSGADARDGDESEPT
ncbi:MAG: twin-arginine translocase subunit TatC [Planctomycetota bacterium]